MRMQRRPMLTIALFASSLWLSPIGCGENDSPTEPAPPVCSIAISPTTLLFTSEGGTGTVSLVTSDASCTWSVSGNPSWIAVVGGSSSGAGSGSVKFNVAANPSADGRSTSFTVGTHTVTITQQGRPPVVCTYALDPMTASFNSDGGTGSVQLTTPAECDWTAVSSASWLAVTSSRTGRGNATIAFAVERNRSAETRSAMITVADEALTITQAGEIPGVCEYSVAPIEFTPCMPAGSIAVTVTTGDSCSWAANASVPWLTITNGEMGSGPGIINAVFSANYDARREGLVRVRWPTPTAGQNVRVAQAGCTYAISKTAIHFGDAGGQGTFDVIQQSDPYTCGGPTQNACIWSAVSDVPWILITSSMPRIGDDPVGFTVSPNVSSSLRTGRITVKEKVLVVTQNGR